MGNPALMDGDMEAVGCIHHQAVLPDLQAYNPLPYAGAPPEHPHPFLLDNGMVPMGPQAQLLPTPPPCYYHAPPEYSFYCQNSQQFQTAMLPPVQSLATPEESSLLQLGDAKVTSMQNPIVIRKHLYQNIYSTVHLLSLSRMLIIICSRERSMPSILSST